MLLLLNPSNVEIYIVSVLNVAVAAKIFQPCWMAYRLLPGPWYKIPIIGQ